MRRVGMLGVLAFAIVGCGASTTATTETTTQTTTVERTPTKAVTKAAASGSSQSFSGNGGKNLGTITVAKDSTVKWTNSGDFFQVFDAAYQFTLHSQAHTGTSALPAGTYKQVYVNAVGNWTINITSR